MFVFFHLFSFPTSFYNIGTSNNETETHTLVASFYILLSMCIIKFIVRRCCKKCWIRNYTKGIEMSDEIKVERKREKGRSMACLGSLDARHFLSSNVEKMSNKI